ncbi:MAG: NAD-dependent malic enzyme [Gemmatimonadota bacterium]|nr:NAD-dependent malic enzyme [Gemmatimonadota bacterium]
MSDPAQPRTSGVDVLREPALNRGTAFTEDERNALGLRGLLPPKVSSQDEQVDRIRENYARMKSDIGRYLYLTGLQDRNEKLFYRFVLDHIEEMMPIIYTPTVGAAALAFGHIYRHPRGLYVTAEDRGRVASVLWNWPHRDVAVIVVTDGERILGLGDLGANGMAIPIGKLSLYSACSGIDPARTLPITIDVGTNNDELRGDPLYLGLDQDRVRGPDYDDLIEEFVQAVQEVFPGALIQFEDFLTPNAYRLLRRYQGRVLSFNDDIQGTAGVALGGLYATTRITGTPLAEQTFLFIGAGSASTGIADLLVCSLVEDGLSEAEARQRCWLVDSKGLIVSGRGGFREYAAPYAHEHETTDAYGAIEALQPTALIGATGHPDTFSREMVELMSEINEKPVLFALSNPTSRAECTAEQAYYWSGGRAVYASGSPFPPVDYEGRRLVPGQANNVYIFPGIGLGVVASGATRVTDDMFLAAARALAGRVSEAALEEGRVYPPLTEIREVSIGLAIAVAELAYEHGLATAERQPDLEAQVRSCVYSVEYGPAA